MEMENIIKKDMTPRLIGETYLRKVSENSHQRCTYGLYECQYCGTQWECRTTVINRGVSKSCGCFTLNRTHNLTSHPLYKTWHNMKDRCYNPKFKQYEDYGGRGIRVCEEWLDIRNFIKWVDTDSNWEEGLSLDRIDNDKEYSPDNCTFSTRTIQSINQRQQSNNTSGYVGINWDTRVSKWRARVHMFKKEKHIGTFKTIEEAVQARDNYIIENNLPHKLSTAYVKETK